MSNILDSLSEEERNYALKILQEYGEAGISSTYNQLLYDDYKEIPVSIGEFIHNKNYFGAGLTDAEGRFTVFPYQEDLLNRIYPDPLKPAVCNTLALTGAIGLGKTLVAVIIGGYELYKILCLKDPYVFYGLQPIDKITFAFINITLDDAKGVAWSKLQNLIQASPQFLAHGELSKQNEPEQRPFQESKIELIYGSLPRHFIGRALRFCLDGDTEIITTEGPSKLDTLVNKQIQVYSIDENGELVISETCTVLPTIETTEEYQIELEDGTLIKCTPTHKFMLKDGTYKEAQQLTEQDELFDYNRDNLTQEFKDENKNDQ